MAGEGVPGAGGDDGDGLMATALETLDALLEKYGHAAYGTETAAIRERAKTSEAQQPHEFQAAEWTHPNGHPRCVVCGCEERTGGMCEGAVVKGGPGSGNFGHEGRPGEVGGSGG